MKNYIVVLFVLCMNFSACKKEVPSRQVDEEKGNYEKIIGETMGTTYHITIGRKTKGIKTKIDKLLAEINDEVSTYIPKSTISKFNKAEKRLAIQDTKVKENTNKHFKYIFDQSKHISTLTEGSFDATVMPIVNYWGFGPQKKNPDSVDKNEIERLLSFVGMDKVQKRIIAKDQNLYVEKTNSGVELDFSAIAKGYAVDQVAFLLEQNAIGNYLVEIGREVKVRGVNPKGELWKIGINTPKIDAETNEVYKILNLENISIASSGNYKNYFELDGKIYSHTINPVTGYPESNNLLSCTVFSEECMFADAYATACMVLGLEKAKALINGQRDLEALLIFSNEDGTLGEYSTAGSKKYLK